MVRLKAVEFHGVCRLVVFQFHYGTIKSGIQIAMCGIWGFQFHYGTIKRQDRQNSLQGLLHFNSTMVRLKALRGCPHAVCRIGFQFHYGTIKRITRYVTEIHAFDNFNSTMVRLKGDMGRRVGRSGLFQFHYGTIKRQRKTCTAGCSRISIPLWYD